MNIFNIKKGFTLVEMLVSLAIFSIVSVIAAGALLKIIDVNKRAQAIKTAVNNVNFTLEAMARDMRTGFDYRCDVNKDFGEDCDKKNMIVFNTSYNSSGPNAATAYRLLSGIIRRADFNPSAGAVSFLPLTADNVNITKFEVSVFNTGSGIPYAQIYVSGEVGKVEKAKSSFEVMTTVSQRLKR